MQYFLWEKSYKLSTSSYYQIWVHSTFVFPDGSATGTQPSGEGGTLRTKTSSSVVGRGADQGHEFHPTYLRPRLRRHVCHDSTLLARPGSAATATCNTTRASFSGKGNWNQSSRCFYALQSLIRCISTFHLFLRSMSIFS